ncbi:hypothetical protein TWF694_003803 [Orbilia ellipsospora]|uniref:Uncharacterized protein n=1 Tax=Orbilia ellipsospora TaxID=2528407 RepID=A0AAV9X1I7_9PEZI
MTSATFTTLGYGYGCEREVLDPTDPHAEPGSAEEWSRFVEEIRNEEELEAAHNSSLLGVPQMPPTTIMTPDLPLALRTVEESESSAAPSSPPPPAELEEPIFEEEDEEDTPALSWSEINESVRWNSLRTDAELQKIEEEYRVGLVARGLAESTFKLTPSSLGSSQIDEEEVLKQLEKMRLESSAWSSDHPGQQGTKPKTKNNKRERDETVSEDRNVRKLVEIAAYHASPEYRTRNHEILRQLEAPLHTTHDDDFPVVIFQPPAVEFEYFDPQAGQKLLEVKFREHVDLNNQIESLEKYLSALGTDITNINAFLGGFEDYKQKLLDDMDAERVRNQERIKEEFRRKEEEEKRRLARMEADRKERERLTKEAEEKKKAEAIKAREEAIKAREAAIKAREEAERKKKEEAERQIKEKRERELAERLRKEKEERERLEKEEALRKAKQAEDEKKKAEEENRKKATAANAQANAQATAQAIENEIETRAQRILGSMPYASNGYEKAKSDLRGHIGRRATFAGKMVRMAPPERRQEIASSQSVMGGFTQYASFRLHIEEVLLRSKLVKAVFMDSEASNLKYALAKKVTQAVGTKAGYLGAAKEDLKILTQLLEQLEKQGVPSVVSIDDFVLERQTKEGLKAPPILFLAMYNFVKTILVKGFTEGPDKPGMMKALAMICNAILGGRAKYWPAAPMSALVYMRFWEQAPTLFGAMGAPTDIGYRMLDGKNLETSTDVNRRAEVATALFCHMGILRLANLKREQVLGPADIYFALTANLNVPVYLRDELHYINLRTIMTIAPWELRSHVGYPGVLTLEKRVSQYCAEETSPSLQAFAALLRGQMDALKGQGYLDQSKAFACDEYKYWDEEDVRDVFSKRGQGEGVPPQQLAVDVAVTNARIRREREEEERFRPSGDAD